jgi:DNA-directed RNA polymerase subunit delta
MTTKSGKENKSAGKTGSASVKADAKKASPKTKKVLEEDDDDELDGDEMETAPVKKSGKPVASSKKAKDDDDDDEVDDAPDDWEKPEEEEEWDPDFQEFDVPNSKGKKASTPGKKSGADDDFKFEEDELKDLFDDKEFDDDEEDDY